MFEMRAKMITVGLLGAAALLPIDHAWADQLGHASWYSLPANMTANGEQMNPNELTAAHRSLPFGTKVLVENLSNGRSVVVRINDRGPFIGGRIIDLSKAAAASIGMINAGTAKVRVTTAEGSALAALGEATAEGSALAALGEATAKAKDGASLAVTAKADIAPAEAPKPKVVAHAGSRVTHTASRKTRSVAATASASAKYSGSRVRVAASAKRAKDARSARARAQMAAAQNGIRAAALQASGLSRRPVTVAWDEHPYAILGATPGFMKPSRTRARRAG
jgi:rare lipoprotein A